MNIIEREKKKYNFLHKRPKYGGRTGRTKVFKNSTDKFHVLVKSAIKESKTMLDVGCGKGAFMDLFRNLYPGLIIQGLDIAEEVKKVRRDLKIDIASADNMPYNDNEFDIVCHMDGMEHIPVEIENKVLKEEVRVSNKWIYHTTAIHAVKHNDDLLEEMGLGAVHINMKTSEEWNQVFNNLCIECNLEFVDFMVDEYWTHALLKKI